MSKITNQPFEQLSKDLGFHYSYLRKRIKGVNDIHQGWELWSKHNGDKKGDEIIVAPITDILATELENTNTVDAGWQLQFQCPDQPVWKNMILVKIDSLCIIEFNQRKNKMTLPQIIELRNRCPDRSDSKQIVTDWLNEKIKGRIHFIKTIKEGLKLWKECKPDSDNAKAIEEKLSGKYFKQRIDKITEVKKVMEIYNFLPAKYFEKLKVLLMRRIYAILSKPKEDLEKTDK